MTKPVPDTPRPELNLSCNSVLGVFAAVDLYGQCVQVTIVTGDRAPAGFSSRRTPSAESLIDESMLGKHSFPLLHI